jgi:hypothetical protein
MKWNIQFDEPNGFLRAYQSGNYTRADQAAFLSDIFSSTFWHTGLPLMIDYCHLDVENIGYTEIASSSEFLISLNRTLGPGKIALLCDDDEQFGVGRQLQMIALIYLDREILVYKGVRAAIDWLICPKRVAGGSIVH